LYAQSSGNSGTISGTVLDPTGAVVPSATVEIHNPGQPLRPLHDDRQFRKFSIPNVPFNPYHMTVTAAGFASKLHRM
jgi:hypothetical protein